MAEQTSEARVFWLHGLFFVSGIPALLYQIVWQRALFTIYGVNIESVTIVVSAFMLGLGLGSLLGGVVSKSRRLPLLVIFGVVELATGAYGILSLKIFGYAALLTAGAPPLKTGLVSFALLILPTALMGSTLPILVAHLVRLSGKVGRSLASLYCVNTLGSAAACFVAAGLTMRLLGQSGTISLAAALNCAVGVAILVVHFFQPGRRASPAATAGTDSGETRVVPRQDARYLPLPIAMAVSGLAGFIALAYEIFWFRAISYAFREKAPTFAVFLGCYLLSLALGAYVSRALCQRAAGRGSEKQLQIIASFVAGANLLGFLVLPATSLLARYELALGSPLVLLSAGSLGAIFPLISEIAVRPDYRAGSGVSYLYLSNIVGSTLGSFLVGYVLMDRRSTQEIAVFLGVSGLVLAGGILIASAPRLRTFARASAACAALAMLLWLSAKPLFDGLYIQLEEKRSYVAGDRYKYLVETKSGIVAVKQDDTVIGAGVYDGVFSTSLTNDRNRLFRPFSMSLWHAAPRQVLMIGLASGSWAQVIANHPQVENLTVVEINPGYLKVIPKYGIVASLLHNPRVSIVIGDGRRWLVRNPGARFDTIVMNTTFHWRSHAAYLLSSDFLQLARRHLNPGGVLFYNTTNSYAAQRTGVSVFPYGVMVGNCLAVSDSPIVPDMERWRRVIMAYKIDGAPVLKTESVEDQKRLRELIAMFSSLEGGDQIRQRTARARIITDDNMAGEW